MIQYKNMLKNILINGQKREDRTGTGTISTFGDQYRYNLCKGFPLVTCKRVPFKSVKSELLWFIEGSDDERRLAEIHFGKPASELIGKETIWTANADNQGKELGYENSDTVKKLGPIYGKQWRKCTSYKFYDSIFSDGDDELTYRDAYLAHDDIDQLANMIDRVKNNPDCRRNILSSWNVAEINDMALPPCHTMFQVYVNNVTWEDRFNISVRDGYSKEFEEYTRGKKFDINFDEFDKVHNIKSKKLNCKLYQRSADTFLGVPFNIASYALLMHMIAQVCDLEVGEFIHTFGDAHIYSNHVEQVQEALKNDVRELPTLKLNPNIKNIDGFTMDDIEIVNYNPHTAIKADMAV